MGFLDAMFRPAAVSTAPGPLADYWYQPFSARDGSVTVNPEVALSISTVWRGVNVLANTLAMIPFEVKRELPNDQGQVNAKDHHLWRTLHDRPNPWQTSFQWRRMGMVHCVLKGNFYSLIQARSDLSIQLEPLNPDHVQPLERTDDGVIYEWTHPRTHEVARLLGGRDILHIPGLGFDGIVGYSVIELMRRRVESAVNMERFGSTLFQRAPLIRGFFKYPKTMREGARETFERSFVERYSGSEGWHGAPVLENGMDWQDAKIMSAEDAQFIESQEFSIPEFARWIGVPTVLLMHVDKTALYANAEQFFQSFLNFETAHWFVNWESTIHQTLFGLDEQQTFRPEFDRSGILRGDAKSRAEYYKAMVVDIQAFTPNEVRVLEGKNTLPGLDEPGPGNKSAPAPAPAPEPDSRPDTADSRSEAYVEATRYHAVLQSAADNLVNRELAETRQVLEKYTDAEVAARRVAQIYARLAPRIVSALAVDERVAEAYCAGRRGELSRLGLDAHAQWESEGAGRLLACAVENDHADLSP